MYIPINIIVFFLKLFLRFILIYIFISENEYMKVDITLITEAQQSNLQHLEYFY